MVSAQWSICFDKVSGLKVNLTKSNANGYLSPKLKLWNVVFRIGRVPIPVSPGNPKLLLLGGPVVESFPKKLDIGKGFCFFEGQ